MTYLSYFLIAASVLLRVLSHYGVIDVPPNIEPIAAMALFGGVYLNRRFALIVPVAAMIVSDYFIGYDLSSLPYVYACFLLSGLIGLWIRDRKNVWTVAGGSLLGSVLFYLITNLVFLYPGAMYSHDLIGQIQSYWNALPFFRNTLLGDLFYVGILFGIYEAVRYYRTRPIAVGNKNS